MEFSGSPRMSKDERKKLHLVYKLLVLAAVLGILAVVWLAWVRPAQQSAGIESYEDCVAAGYPVQESNPPVCVTPDGTSFTGPLQLPQEDE